MKYAHIDKNNKLLGWYADDIHSTIPTPNIPVSDEQWQVAINNGHNKVNSNGSTELFDFRTEEEIASQEQEQINAQSRAYLASTDWYVIRKFERNIDIPVEVVKNRENYIKILNK